jgi:hypothetical protein
VNQNVKPEPETTSCPDKDAAQATRTPKESKGVPIKVDNRLEKITSAIRAISFAIAIVGSEWATSWAKSQQIKAPWLPPAVALVTVVIGYLGVEYILSLVFETQRWLRGLLVGRQFIEGKWFVSFWVGDKLVAVGITDIEARRGSVCFTGEDYMTEEAGGGQTIVMKGGKGHYITDLAELEWPRIKYKYSYFQSGEESAVEGYGEAQFVEERRRPNKYSGRFRELGSARVTYYEGWRITNNFLLKRLEKEPLTRRDEVRTFFSDPMDPMKKERGESSPGGAAPTSG